MSALCGDECPVCGAPCDRRIDDDGEHVGQHHCINCGTKWWNDLRPLNKRELGR